MNDEPIFLLGAHKSGTTLLRSIFDSHPDLFVIPFESHFFQDMGYWVDYNYRKEHPKALGREEIITRFTERLKHLSKTKDQVGDSPQEVEIDLAGFQKSFIRLTDKMSNRACFGLLAEAYHQALFGTPIPAQKRIMEKSVEHAEFAVFLQQMFPKAKFVHIVRNPYANIVSLRKAKVIQSRFPLIFRALDSLYNNYYNLYRNRQLIDSYYVIRYEDLLEQPEVEIKKIADFLDLSFDPILLQPTKSGRPWGGNSSTTQRLSGFDQSRIDSWKGTVSPMEILFLNRLLDYPFVEFGYSKLPNPSIGKFLKPVEQEGITRYLVNRLYLIYLSYNPGKQI